MIGGRSVASAATPSNPNPNKSSLSTKTTITRTGLSPRRRDSFGPNRQYIDGSAFFQRVDFYEGGGRNRSRMPASAVKPP
jgi:hypothetical protein